MRLRVLAVVLVVLVAFSVFAICYSLDAGKTRTIDKTSRRR